MVSDNTPPGSNTAQVFKSQLAALGFNVQLHPVEHAIMYTKFCSVVANEPNVCPNVGWVKDFNDGQAMIDVPFNGATITGQPDQQLELVAAERPGDQRRARTRRSTSPTRPQRAAAYGKIDDKIMALAPAIPWDWDYEANVGLDQRGPRDQPVQRSHRPVVHVASSEVNADGHAEPVSGRARRRMTAASPTAVHTERSPMVRYIVRRILWGIAMLFIVSAVIFLIFYVLPSADPAVLRAGRNAGPAQIAADPPFARVWTSRSVSSTCDYMRTCSCTSTSATAISTTSRSVS